MAKTFKQFSRPLHENKQVLEEENKPTNPELWSRAKALAKKKFDVYPSAYANGWASKWYKSKGGSWKSMSEEIEPEKKDEYDGEVDMAQNQLKRILSHAQHFHDMLTDKNQNLPEWVQSKITKAEDYISTAHDYMMGEMQEEYTYTAFHNKHGEHKVQASSTYDAAKKAAAKWNTGKKGTQGIDVHLHTDKPKAYAEETIQENVAQGHSAFKAGKKYSENPHPKGSQAHLNWSKGHNQARANKLTNEDTPALMKPKQELPPHIKALMKKASGKTIPRSKSSHGTMTDVTPKGYGPNEDVHPETYKAQSVYDNAHTDATKKGHSETQAHKHASGVMKKKHPGFSATSGEGQVYKESESLKEVSKKTLRSYIPKAANSLSNNAQGRAFNISANMDKTNKDMQKHYDQRMTVRMRGIHNATKQLTKEDNDILNELSPKTLGSYVKKAHKDATNHSFDHGESEYRQYGSPDDEDGHEQEKELRDRERAIANRAKGIKTATNKIVKKATTESNTPASRYMAKRKSIKESSALTRISNKLKDIETRKSFEKGESRIPTPEERRKQMSKKANVVKEVVKKTKKNSEEFQDSPELGSSIDRNNN